MHTALHKREFMDTLKHNIIHVVPHSHWDREWYFTTSRSKVYLMKNFADVLDVLESDERFKTWMLDGQASLLDDYLAWRPQDEARIRKLAETGRLILGPWYTQSDLMIISAESIVRNLLYGIRRSKALGACMLVGYVPDSFGQAANMPQIYKQAGFESTLFWRGVSDDMVRSLNFEWIGDDGTSIFATQMPTGYYVGGLMPEDFEANDVFWKEQCFEPLASRHASEHVYFPCGFDQAPVRKNLPDLLEMRNQQNPNNEYRMSSLPEYTEAARSAIQRDGTQLERVQGELLVAKHMRIHRSIWSSRSDLKQLNTQLQFYVVNVLEPLLVISRQLGNSYPQEALKQIWKLLFENAAHDSIGSCIADTANEDVYLRYKQIRDIAESLVELHSRLISTQIASDSNAAMTFTVFNPLPELRSDVIVKELYIPGEDFSLYNENNNPVAYTILESENLTDYVKAQTIKLNPSKQIYTPQTILWARMAFAAEDIPPMGYKQYSLICKNSSQAALKCSLQPIDVPHAQIENDWYVIALVEDGSLSITDKSSGYCYRNQAIIVENGDDGDSFNYSPPRADCIVRSTESPFKAFLTSSELYKKLTVEFSMQVPQNLSERSRGIRSHNLPVVLEVCLRKEARVIDCEVHVDNRGVDSHRLTIEFDADMSTTQNYADQQFGPIVRANEHAQEIAWYEAQKDAWQEPPLSIEPTQSYVALSDGVRSLAVLPGGVREYEILGKTQQRIALTLMRSYGFMGKEDLLYRPGRASGEKTITTPQAQLHKQMDFQLGLLAYKGSVDDAHIARLARGYRTPLQLYPYSEFLNGRLIFSEPPVKQSLAQSYSFFELTGDAVLSACKAAESPDMPGIILRFFNPLNDGAAALHLHFENKVSAAYLCNLQEEKTEALTLNGNELVLPTLGHCKFLTVYVEF